MMDAGAPSAAIGHEPAGLAGLAGPTAIVVCAVVASGPIAVEPRAHACEEITSDAFPGVTPVAGTVTDIA